MALVLSVRPGAVPAHRRGQVRAAVRGGLPQGGPVQPAGLPGRVGGAVLALVGRSAQAGRVAAPGVGRGGAPVAIAQPAQRAAHHARDVLAPAVEIAVQRQDQHGMVGDLERLRRDGYALLVDALHFVEEMPGIDHDAVADDGELAGAHHARGQQRQLIGDAIDDERVAGIVTALETHHHIGAGGQPIDDLAFTFVAPLGTDNHNIAAHQISFQACFTCRLINIKTYID